MLTQYFILEGRPLGTSPREGKFSGGILRLPYSALFFCQHCGEVFARCPIMSDDGSIRPWQSYRATCRKCLPDFQSEWPGSLWLSFDPDFCAALPVPVLQQEVLRHIENFERFNHDNSYS